MIPPLPHGRTPGDGKRPSATPPETSAASVRFVDLLAERSGPFGPALTDARNSAPSDTSARMFNQDGFFGDAVDTAFGPPPSSSPTVPFDGAPRAPEVNADTIAFETKLDVVPAAGRASGGEIPIPMKGADANSECSSSRIHAVSSEVLPDPMMERRRTDAVQMREGVSSRTPQRIARPFPLASSAVAVAVHALTNGLEVSVRFAALDSAERIRLADEIAAFLSSHGYPAGRITIFAHKENR